MKHFEKSLQELQRSKKNIEKSIQELQRSKKTSLKQCRVWWCIAGTCLRTQKGCGNFTTPAMIFLVIKSDRWYQGAHYSRISRCNLS